MPKRQDIKKIMIIGSGPIVIGQGCEFDYSGVQACKALKKEGYEIILVNSNPATIMTDPEFADRTYIEPLTADILHEIIRRERPDALLANLGGQTALNLGMELNDSGVLKRYHVELIGSSAESIFKAEDRQAFKEAMLSANLEMPRSGSAHTLTEALAIAATIGTWPLIIRPGFTLGGTGGGIAHDISEFESIVTRGLAASKNREVLIEESLLGWAEFEMELIRDKNDNIVVVCSIENFDPMGVHTGDSITMAPQQTLTREAYQGMLDDSITVMHAVGVSSGGANVQWAVDPISGRRIIIEMNPRVSRSSALASKATGFPIAKISALLAVGYTLDELIEEVKVENGKPACYEVGVDYLVTKVPRFTFEKFPKANSVLGTQMKSVGEAMSIGANFKESFQKALRSLETGRFGFGADGKDAKYEAAADEEVAYQLTEPHADRVFYIRAAIKRGWTIDQIYEMSKIDRFFLNDLKELVDFEDKIKAVGSIDKLAANVELFTEAKKNGYSDRQIAFLTGSNEEEVAKARKNIGLMPNYAAVNTYGKGKDDRTPYYYSTYHGKDLPIRDRGGKKAIMILGGGPNRIGQGIEFDYCCVHAAFALAKTDYESIMVNSNPETVSTDYDTSDKLYFEPLTLEDVMNIYHRERCDGVIVQYGGQTPLNLAEQLETAGAHIIGTSPESIKLAEDRDYFKKLVTKLGINQPASGIAFTVEEAVAVAAEIGYPVLIRPSFVLGGRGMIIAYQEDNLREYVKQATDISAGAILIDSFLENATELDVDCISDGETTVIGAIMEHVEPAGIHSGDSASIIPPVTLTESCINQIRSHAYELAKSLKVCGLMNIQFAVQKEKIYIIEVNPRASRTVPFVSKAIGVPLAQLATRCMLGTSLKELGFTKEIKIPYVAVKEAVFPFIKFPGADMVLSPEMRSTGEVMGLDYSRGLAYLKSQLAAGNELPSEGSIFISVKDEDKPVAIELSRELSNAGFKIYATQGTSTVLYDAGIMTNAVYRITSGRPNFLDLIDQFKWIITTAEGGEKAMIDETMMRSKAVERGIPITTTLPGMVSAVIGIKEKRDFGRFEVYSLQEYQRHIANFV